MCLIGQAVSMVADSDSSSSMFGDVDESKPYYNGVPVSGIVFYPTKKSLLVSGFIDTNNLENMRARNKPAQLT